MPHRPGRAPARATCSIALGDAAVQAGHKVRYFTAADLAETLYRGLADNTVGKIIDIAAPQRPDHHRRNRLRAARRHRRPAAVPRSSPPPTNAAPWASPRTGPSTNGAGSCPSTPPPSACSTGCCTTPPSSSPTATPTACAKPEPKGEPAEKELTNPRGGDFYLATSGDHHLTIDTQGPRHPLPHWNFETLLAFGS